MQILSILFLFFEIEVLFVLGFHDQAYSYVKEFSPIRNEFI